MTIASEALALVSEAISTISCPVETQPMPHQSLLMSIAQKLSNQKADISRRTKGDMHKCTSLEHGLRELRSGERPWTQRCRQRRKNACSLRKRIGNDGESRKMRGDLLKRRKARRLRRFWRRTSQLRYATSRCHHLVLPDNLVYSIPTRWEVQSRSVAVGDMSSGKASEICSLILSSSQVRRLISYRWCS
ncbi:hypothetical protein EV702DRAFT_740510 [Suillus placidus]|uniref:Uncharacterized protein n=1 Tax=Suillus placidus TaxID=48579 RepID=A0A9P6ZIU6_9AGAM|nr:hypothetical protein EV702DRAFT_740510 [Suillus placidus]